MKNLFIIIAVLFSFNATAQDNHQAADLLLKGLITKNNVVGASAGYTVDGNLIWQNTAGFANEKANQSFELETVVRIASIAKSMTAVAVMQLVEQGKIDLDEPIQTYIPGYPNLSKTAITTRHLLSHTSGIDGYKDGKEAQTEKNYATLSDALELFKNRDLLFESGTQYHYTTYGYTVLGVIVERVSGLTFGQYMQQNIWGKADMKNTGVVKFGEKAENQSCLYHQNKKGKSKLGKENNLSNRIPGGGFYSTLGDMLKFGNAVLNHTLVKDSTLDLMRQHHSLEKEANGYGFGWFLYNPKPNEGKIIGHSGEQTGSCTQLVIVPSKKLVVIILTNTSGTYKYVTPTTFNLMNLALEEQAAKQE